MNSVLKAFSISPCAAVDTGAFCGGAIGTCATGSGSGGDAARAGVCGVATGGAARDGAATEKGGLPLGTARRRVTTSGSPDLPPRRRIIVTGELGCPPSKLCASSTCHIHTYSHKQRCVDCMRTKVLTRKSFSRRPNAPRVRQRRIRRHQSRRPQFLFAHPPLPGHRGRAHSRPTTRLFCSRRAQCPRPPAPP